MAFRVGIIFAGPHADHTVRSPLMDHDQARAEFRVARQQREQGAVLSRDWVYLPNTQVVAIHMVEEPE
jgi:hypothetical protein